MGSLQNYCLRVGGLAWPVGGKPGVVVALGKNWELDFTLHTRKMKVLALKEAENLNDLLRYYHELQAQFKMDFWLGNTSDRPMVNYAWNYAQRIRKSFSLGTARNCADPKNLAVYLSMIQDLSRRTRKVLEYGEYGPFFESYLNGMSPEDKSKPAEEHPPIAALAYALSELQDYEPVDEDDEEPRQSFSGQSAVTGY